MIVAVKVNKCNITGLAINELNELIWGISTKCKDGQSSILENYIQYLACPTVDLVTCYPDNCNNPTIENVCNVSINAISYTIVENTITFFIDSPDITGATFPLTYVWSYDTEVFDLVSANTTSSTLIVSFKDGKEIEDTVTFITVVIVDTNQCTANKFCNLVASTMICNDEYEPCPNAENLQIANSAIPFFNIVATTLNSITNSFTIISSDNFSINWGDGTVDSFLAGTRTPTHTYSDPYTGYIKVSCVSLVSITSLVLGTSLAGIVPSTNALSILTTEIHKLTGLLVLSLGDQVFLNGIVADLPSALTTLGTFVNNLTGTTLQLPRNLTILSITGLNTISGNVSDLPPSLVQIIFWGLNTLTGNVLGLPRGITLLGIHGNNTISGAPIGLPPNIIVMELLGNNTMSGDIAGWPNTSTNIIVYGNNTLFGNIANLPSGLIAITILGVNIITGTLSDIPSTVTSFQIVGHNTISGDVALIPAGIRLIIILSSFSTIDTYTVGLRTWNATMNTVRIEPGVGGLDSTEVDNILIELAAQTSLWNGDHTVSILGGSSSRTAASNAAVATLVGMGVIVNTVP